MRRRRSHVPVHSFTKENSRRVFHRGRSYQVEDGSLIFFTCPSCTLRFANGQMTKTQWEQTVFYALRAGNRYRGRTYSCGQCGTIVLVHILMTQENPDQLRMVFR